MLIDILEERVVAVINTRQKLQKKHVKCIDHNYRRYHKHATKNYNKIKRRMSTVIIGVGLKSPPTTTAKIISFNVPA